MCVARRGTAAILMCNLSHRWTDSWFLICEPHIATQQCQLHTNILSFNVSNLLLKEHTFRSRLSQQKKAQFVEQGCTLMNPALLLSKKTKQNKAKNKQKRSYSFL